MTLQSIAEVTGTDPEANEEYEAIMGPEFLKNGDIQPAPFTTLPDYPSALDLNFVDGKRIGYNGTTCTVRAAGNVLHADAYRGSDAEGQGSARSGRGDHGARRIPHDAGGAAAAERLRAARDDRRLLQASGPARAGEEPQARGRSRRTPTPRRRSSTATRLTSPSPKSKTRRAEPTSRPTTRRCRKRRRSTTNDRKDGERTERRRRPSDRHARLGSERPGGGRPGDHGPDGLHRDPAPFGQHRHQRRPPTTS